MTTLSSELSELSPLGSPKRNPSKKTISASQSHTKLDKVLNPIQSSTIQDTTHPYRIVLDSVRRKLLHTKTKMEALLLGDPSEIQDTYDSSEPFLEILIKVYESLKECGSEIIANGRLLDLIRRVHCFGLSLMKIDIREDAEKHVVAMDEITKYLKLESYADWDEEQRIKFLVRFVFDIRGDRYCTDERASMESSVDFAGHTNDVANEGAYQRLSRRF